MVKVDWNSLEFKVIFILRWYGKLKQGKLKFIFNGDIQSRVSFALHAKCYRNEYVSSGAQ